MTTLSPTILASDSYLSLAEPDEHTDRLVRTLGSAVSRCESYTGRRITSTTAASEVVVVRGTGDVFRVPDLADLSSIAVLDGPTAGPIDVDRVELITWRSAPTAVWVRLPVRVVGRARVQLSGQFGMDPIVKDLEDSLYTYASFRWRERDAMFSGRVALEEGGEVTQQRRLPTIVRGVWDEYEVPERSYGAIPIR